MYLTESQNTVETYCKLYRDSVRPLTDIFESETSYILKLDMPGIDKDALEITLNNDSLAIYGKVLKESDASENKKRMESQEYHLSDYFRLFRLDHQVVDDKSIEAKLDNGVLTLTLPKSEKSKPRIIPIHS